MPRPQSMLFKKTSKQLLLILKNQYLSEQGKAKNIYRREIGDKKYETVPETINRHLAREMPKTERLFETAIIDEGK